MWRQCDENLWLLNVQTGFLATVLFEVWTAVIIRHVIRHTKFLNISWFCKNAEPTSDVTTFCFSTREPRPVTSRSMAAKTRDDDDVMKFADVSCYPDLRGDSGKKHEYKGSVDWLGKQMFYRFSCKLIKKKLDWTWWSSRDQESHPGSAVKSQWVASTRNTRKYFRIGKKYQNYQKFVCVKNIF